MCSVPELHQLRTEFRGVFGAEPELEPRSPRPLPPPSGRCGNRAPRPHTTLPSVVSTATFSPNVSRTRIVSPSAQVSSSPAFELTATPVTAGAGANVRRRPPGEGRPLGDRDVPDRVVPGRVGGNRHPLAGRHRPVQCHRRPGALPACGGRRHAVREPHRRTGARPAVDARGPHAALGVSGVSDARDGGVLSAA